MFFSVSASSVSAVDAPNFPQCANPGGSVIARYDSGVHGVPGDATTYTGKDSVFKLNDAQVVQCLCPDSGSGVQTLWWKNPGLSVEDEAKIISQGWVRVPNGSLWGLDQDVYFAKNSNFNCNEGGTGGVNGSSDSKSSSSSNGLGSILGATTLAGTGNAMTIFGVFLLAAGALVAGVFTRKLSR
jgi:hypothetical protein